jgi:hypothetical protein
VDVVAEIAEAKVGAAQGGSNVRSETCGPALAAGERGGAVPLSRDYPIDGLPDDAGGYSVAVAVAQLAPGLLKQVGLVEELGELSCLGFVRRRSESTIVD